MPWNVATLIILCVRLCVCFLLILGVFCSHNQISAALMEMRVRPGDNIVLYCDCKFSTGVYITWYRNCSHETHHTQLKLMRSKTNKTDPLRFFHYLRNDSSDSYDLLILNITDSDAGLYYCGTEETRVEDKEYIKWKTIYSYGRSVTRILLSKYPGLISLLCNMSFFIKLKWWRICFTIFYLRVDYVLFCNWYRYWPIPWVHPIHCVCHALDDDDVDSSLNYCFLSPLLYFGLSHLSEKRYLLLFHHPLFYESDFALIFVWNIILYFEILPR